MNALEMRRRVKKKKPEAIMADHHKRKEIKKRWRNCRGKHAKIRLNKKGRQRAPRIGYGSPAAVKGLNIHGLKEATVHSVNELNGLDSKTTCVTVAAGVGVKKRIGIVKKAQELKIKVTNIKDNYIEDIQKKFAERKKAKAEIKKKKEAKKETKKKTIEEELTEEERAKAEKAEKDKVLTRREI